MSFVPGTPILPTDVLGLALSSGSVANGTLTLNLTNGTSSVAVSGNFLTGVIPNGSLAVGGSGGSVSSLVIGAGLSSDGSTLTATGGLTPISAQTLLGNPGTASATPSALTIGSGLTIVAGNTLTAAGGGGSPGGSNGQIQVNSAGTFGGLATTGTGNAVLATSPALTTPNLGVPTALTLTNATGLPPGGITAIGGLSVIGNGGTTSSVPGTLLLSPSSFVVVGGTIFTSGTLASVDISTGTGLLFNGQVFTNAGTNQATYLGINAGAVAQSGTVTPGLGCTFVGDSAGQNFQTGSECTLIGALAGQMLLTAGGCTAVGEHALGYDLSGSGSCAFGGDAMRNWVYGTGLGNSNGFGTDSLYNGSGDSDVAVGNFAQRGNPSALLIGGTISVGETITIGFAAASTILPGGTLSIPYVTTSTVAATVATGLAAVINANTVATAHLSLGVPNPANVQDSTNIYFGWVGNSLFGQAVTATASTTGSASLTVLGGYSGSNNTSIGARSMQGFYLTTANNNSVIGCQSFEMLQSGSGNVGAGYQAGLATTTGSSNIFIGNQVALANLTSSFNVVVGPNAFASYNGSNGSHVAIGQAAMGNFTNASLQCVAVGANALQGAVGTTASGCTAVGYQSLKVVTTGSFNTAMGYLTGTAATTAGRLTLVGYSAGSTITTGANNTIIGAQVASTTLATGSGNILIGTSSAIDTPLAATSNYLSIQNVIIGTGINTAATSTVTVAGTLGVGSGFVIQVGTATPTGTAAAGSIGINTAGAAGSHVYISQGNGTWTAIALV